MRISMRISMLNTPDDLSWLKDGALKGVTLPERWAPFKCAVLHGNEDSPTSVDLFEKGEPLVTDAYYKVQLDVEPAEFCIGQKVVPSMSHVPPETYQVLRRG